MSKKIAELTSALQPENDASWVSNLWDTFNNQRASKMVDWEEIKKYIFATDTRTTSNASLPWKNSTTLPKLTQIRDNLHSNYLSALFPNDKWLKWQAYNKDSAKRDKARNITAYMENKTRESNYRTEVSKLLYDYIDYGNAFCTVVFETKYKTSDITGEKVVDYVGPKLVRISPEDIVFNPLANSFGDTFKIVRSIKTLGEIKRLAETEPDQAFWLKVIDNRNRIRELGSGYKRDDFNKAIQYQVDGFGNMYEYFQNDYVEILEFFGDYHDATTGIVHLNRIVTIADRSIVVRNEEIPTYSGRAPIWHVGWRFRPDNLWAMGPLDNLVGMQYRIDHLENLKADAMDLIVHPPLKIIGEVEEFVWRPGGQIHIDENGDVAPISSELNSLIVADSQIADLEARMELYAGAPREAMGMRTPGEKTAFEVQSLENAAGRIFQEKITNFEINLVEPSLNGMLETARRNFDGRDMIRVLDTSLGSTKFFEITKEDITASGILRPIGARHFAQQAQELQNLLGIANSPLWTLIAPHTSGKNLTSFIEDITSISGYEIFKPNIGILEQQETQGMMQQASEDLEMQATVPVETESVPKGVI